MAIGHIVAEARTRSSFTKESLARELEYSASYLDKWERGERNIPQHVLPVLAEKLDDVELYFATWQEVAGGVSLPLLNGDYVDKHSTSMMVLVKKETGEAIEQLKQVCWVKPIQVRDERDKEELKKAIFEVLDAATSMINLVAVICMEHKFSMRKIFKEWRLTLKARRLAK